MIKNLALALALPLAATAVSAQASDWNGAYVGGSYDIISGGMHWYMEGQPDDPYDIDSGNAMSVFAGYLIDTGTLVYGAEISMSVNTDIVVPGYEEAISSNILDAKAKVGHKMDNALIYAVAGYSQMELADTWVPDDHITGTLSGIVYGAGVDVQVTDSMFVGIEYLIRSVSNDDFYEFGAGFAYDTSAIQIRAGYTF